MKDQRISVALQPRDPPTTSTQGTTPAGQCLPNLITQLSRADYSVYVIQSSTSGAIVSVVTETKYKSNTKKKYAIAQVTGYFSAFDTTVETFIPMLNFNYSRSQYPHLSDMNSQQDPAEWLQILIGELCTLY